MYVRIERKEKKLNYKLYLVLQRSGPSAQRSAALSWASASDENNIHEYMVLNDWSIQSYKDCKYKIIRDHSPASDEVESTKSPPSHSAPQHLPRRRCRDGIRCASTVRCREKYPVTPAALRARASTPTCRPHEASRASRRDAAQNSTQADMQTGPDRKRLRACIDAGQLRSEIEFLLPSHARACRGRSNATRCG